MKRNVNRILSLIPDKTYLKLYYRLRTGKKLNLKEPKTFNEKMQWLKLYWRKDTCTVCVDKYKAREYVSRKVGEEILTKLYGVYDSVDEIDILTLPEH